MAWDAKDINTVVEYREDRDWRLPPLHPCAGEKPPLISWCLGMLSLIYSAVFYVGTVTLVVGLRKLASIIHVYGLHSSTIQRYLTDDDLAYALITGSSDGLGKQLAIELYERGVGLHSV
jgi:hypothetical protein